MEFPRVQSGDNWSQTGDVAEEKGRLNEAKREARDITSVKKTS